MVNLYKYPKGYNMSLYFQIKTKSTSQNSHDKEEQELF